MSEFFKALEQAERDRLRESESEARTAPTVARKPAPDAARPEAMAPPAAPVREPAAAPPVVTPVREPVVAPPVVAPVREPVVAPRQEPRPGSVTPPAKPAPSVGPFPKPKVKRISEPSWTAVPAAAAATFRPALETPRRSLFRKRFGGQQPRLVAQTDPGSVEANAYRTVRANIELMSDDGGFRHIAITSPAGGDGKSTTAANLAVVAAQSGRRVCLVDADFGHPTLHQIFGLSNTDGLTLALEHGKPLHTLAKATDVENLSVVVAGRVAQEAYQDLLTAPRLDKILRESEAAYDLVIFDSPPINSVADALSVAAVCDGVVLVVRAGSIPFDVLRRTIAQVKQVKGRVVGVLLNQADPRTTDAGAYRYYQSNGSRAQT